jgi:hypothetical protein
MSKYQICLSLAGAATLAACVATEPVAPAPTAAIVTAPVVVASAPPAAGAAVVVPQGAVVAPGAAPTVVVPTLRAGYARIESITPIAGTDTGSGSGSGASSGSGTSGASAGPLRRVGLKMEDGTVQFVDTRAPNLVLGDRVQITADSQMRYPVPAAERSTRY